MRSFVLCSAVLLASAGVMAQDPGMMAAQQAQMAAQQATQQAQMAAQQASQQATQNAQLAQRQAMQCSQCYAATPKLSVQAGKYSAPITVKIKTQTRGAIVYYTTDGWTPTASSTRYTGPITISSTTKLQAVAITPTGYRSRIAFADYTLPAGVAASVTQASSSTDSHVLSQGTPVPLAFAKDVTSKGMDVGDKIPLTLAEDLKAGDVVILKKGTPSEAIVTEVDQAHILGTPGEIVFEVNSIASDGTVVKLRGTAAKEGEDKAKKAAALLAVPFVPAGLFVHGKEAEIKQGTIFIAYVAADMPLPAASN